MVGHRSLDEEEDAAAAHTLEGVAVRILEVAHIPEEAVGRTPEEVDVRILEGEVVVVRTPDEVLGVASSRTLGAALRDRARSQRSMAQAGERGHYTQHQPGTMRSFRS